jgi:hypothetical protein
MSVVGTTEPGSAVRSTSYLRSMTAGQVGRRLRLPLGITGLVIVIGVLTAVARGGGRSSVALDPDNPLPGGAMALAQLLGQRGVPVQRVPQVPSVPTVPASQGSQVKGVLFVPEAGVLPPSAVRRLARLARAGVTVVVATGSRRAAADLGLQAGSVSSRAEPGCALAEARSAGAVAPLELSLRSAEVTGPVVGGQAIELSCYGGALVRAGSLTVLGAPQLAENGHLGEQGNAALLLGLLDQGRPVTWVLPRPGEVSADEHPVQGDYGLGTVLPEGVGWLAAQLVVAIVLLGVARGRRLGPVVRESLPVLVPSTETVRGRARLWQRAQARDRAALALREHARGQLAGVLALPPSTTPGSLVLAVAHRSGVDQQRVHELLYGPDPGEDSALVALADALTDLHHRTRTPPGGPT